MKSTWQIMKLQSISRFTCVFLSCFYNLEKKKQIINSPIVAVAKYSNTLVLEVRSYFFWSIPGGRGAYLLSSQSTSGIFAGHPQPTMNLQAPNKPFLVEPRQQDIAGDNCCSVSTSMSTGNKNSIQLKETVECWLRKKKKKKHLKNKKKNMPTHRCHCKSNKSKGLNNRRNIH